MATRYCQKCKGLMDYRLGAYECTQCGATEVPTIEAEPQVLKGLSSHKNLDPGAAYKLINPDVPDHVVQLMEELQPKFGPKARRVEKKTDAMRDERIISALAVLLVTAGNIYTLLFQAQGMDKVQSFVDQTEWISDPQTLSNVMLFASGLGAFLVIAALYIHHVWFKYVACLILVAVMIITVLGILTPGGAHDICYSWQGLAAIVSSLWVLIVFSRDIPNTHAGDQAQ